MSSRILTIDIRQEQISSVLLVNGLKGISIVETACIEIAQDREGIDEIQETAEDKFFQAVLDAFEKIPAKIIDAHDRCIISVPSSYFFFRTLDLPFKNRKKIARFFHLN